jgi:hypothetical protein
VKLATYLRNRAPGLALAQASLLPKLEALAPHYSLLAVALGCIVWQLVKALRKRPHRAQRRALHRHLLGPIASCDTISAPAPMRWSMRWSMRSNSCGYIVTVHPVPSRGSMRRCAPYLYVHKGLTQGFLELFRAYFNLRTRR